MFLRIKKSKLLLLIFAVSLLVWFVTQVYARSGGINGYTSSLSPGCNCHSSQANPATQLTASSKSGSYTFAPGDSAIFTITVTNPNNPYAGIDIGVKTTLTGETDAGALYPITGLKHYSTELTHNNKRQMSNGSYDFVFSWKAPATPGKYYLRAIANAVNGNGGEDPGDQWNRLQPIEITVAAPLLSFDKPTLDFQETKVTQFNENEVKLKNTSSASVTVNAVDIIGQDESAFSFEPIMGQFVLAPNTDTTIKIRFVPYRDGNFSATLQVYTDGVTTPQTLPITATAIPSSVRSDIPEINSANIYPNPLNGDNFNLSISLLSPQGLNFEIYNNLGESILKLPSQEVPEGESQIGFNLSGLAILPGVYNLVISDGKNASVIKLIKIK